MRSSDRVVSGSRTDRDVLRVRHERLGHGVARIGCKQWEWATDIGSRGSGGPHALQEKIAERKILLVHVVEIASGREMRRMASDISHIQHHVAPQLALNTEGPTQNLRQPR